MRKKTSRYKKKASGPREVNLRATSGRVVWCRTKAGTWKAARWIVGLTILAVAAVLGKSAMQQIFHDSDEFALEEVELWQWDSEETPVLLGHSRLAQITGIQPKASIFSFQLDELEAKLGALPEIEKVRATRRLPDVLRIRVKERVPVAWIDAPHLGIVRRNYDDGLLVDEDGYCFLPTRAMLETVNDLPVITTGDGGEGKFVSGQKAEGREFMRALELVKLSKRYLADAGWSLPAIGLRNEYSLLAKTHTGTVVTFGLYEQERQLKDLLLILEHASNTDRGIERVNLIPERNIPVVFAQAGIPSQTRSALESSLQAILNRS